MRTSVTGNDCRYSKPLDPPGEQCCSARCGGGGRQEYRFRPPGGSVHNGEEVCCTFRDGEWPHNVHVDMCKPAQRNRNVFWLQGHMAVNFSPLAAEAGPGDGGYLTPHVRPAEGCCNQTCCCTYSGVVHVVQRQDCRLPELRRQQWAENTCRHVAKDGVCTILPGDNLQRWRRKHGRHVRAGWLGHRQGGKIYR